MVGGKPLVWMFPHKEPSVEDASCCTVREETALRACALGWPVGFGQSSGAFPKGFMNLIDSY